jgi:hypothetical protein
MRKKYDFTASTEPDPEPLFSQAEEKALARLVAKFGRETVADAAMQVPLPRGRGRPALSRHKSLEEADSLLWFIDKYTEEARQDGSKHPVTDALNVACEVTGLSLKTIKNQRSEAAKIVARMGALTPEEKRRFVAAWNVLMKKGPD